ncbi:MAG TPA: BTAD domain-containing putative transcriptional regulator [Actinocrinis sp.]|jgi:DNA-binding SARP family transcriptional activator|uniref:AfsR/SARP family transcriptional regulator n=1 Tax=Actinocrinis sp. TaxID=1920516 RepID=UPI002DDCB770|nr:BTAD domain-containing putative transcriptional regulator [Actinocrinis sp.]HEV3169932.1 BTAD domain-containing putative transcriptional regulator [Actinocrinis sp.]
MSRVPVRFGVLGPLRVVADGAQELALLSAGRLRTLLAVLLWRANEAVPVDELSELVWDGAPPPGAAAALRSLVLRLRRTLGPQAGARILTRSPGYLIELSDDELDATRFEALFQDTGSAVRTGSWADAFATATRALDLWRGTPLADVPCQALQDAWIPHLDQHRLQTLEWRIEAALQLGHQDRVVTELQGLTVRHPLRERFHAQLMLALAGTGRQAEALEAYRNVRRVLVDQLGIEPGPELRDLQERILAGDAALRSPIPEDAGIEPGPETVREHRRNLDEKRAAGPPASAPRASAGGHRSVPAQLPSGVFPFVGRADQFRDLSRHLLGPAGATTPLALITGTGGCGKTELAVHWARGAAAHFPDGQLYLDLQGYSHLRPLTPLAALGSLLRALGVPGDQIPDTPLEAAGLFRSRAAGRRLLFLLDNARSVEQVRPLIPGDSGCAVLVTSRHRLDGLVARNGARRVPVDVLALDDAVSLLAQILGPEHSATDVARLAQACACLPLALRIAAAHLDGAPPGSLGRYLELLETDAWPRALRITGDEHSSVHAAFQLSYDSLGAAEQELFRLLGLVPGAGFTAGVAAALADIGPDEAEQRLERLTAAHLVGRVSHDRYTFHDLLQAYARGLATAAGAVKAPLRRLAEWYLATVRSTARTAYPQALRLPEEPTVQLSTRDRYSGTDAAQDWFDREHHNIMAQIDQAAASGNTDVAWRLAFAYRPHLFARSHAQPMHEAGATALAAASADGDPVGQAAARLTLAIAAEKLGALAEAAEHARRAAQLCDKTGWTAGQAAALNDLGVVRIQDGRLREAADAFELNIAAMRENGDRQGEAHARANLGYLLAMSGRLREGVDQFRQAADFYSEHGPRRKLTPVLAGLGVTYRELGEFAQAEPLLVDAIAIGAQSDEPYFTCTAEGTLAELCCDLGDIARAREHLERADELAERTGLAKLAALTAIHHGWFELVQGRADAARPWYERVLSYGRSAGDPWYQARGLIGVSACLRADKQAEACIRAAARALHSAQRSGHRVQIAEAHLELSQAHAEFGHPHRALTHARHAADIAEECDHHASKQTAARIFARLEGLT